MFENLTDKLERSFKILKGEGRITEINIAETLKEIRRALIDADVNYKVAKSFTDEVKQKALGQNVLTAVKPGQMMTKIVRDELAQLMGGTATDIRLEGTPAVILIAGLQGSGKTTFSGKLAAFLKEKKGRHVLLVAGDVYRPAAIDQLEVVGKAVDTPVFTMRESREPEKIALAAIKEAERKGCNVLIVDTAGRLQIDEELMEELVRLKGAIKPHEILLVVDALTGQDAVNAAEGFNDRLGIDGIIMTKMDGDSRGGAALSAKKVTGRPVKFVGTGEKFDALEPFHPERMASRILGMGDMLTLIEKAQEDYDEQKAQELEKRLRKNQFTLEDFLEQMGQIRKMGGIGKLLGMMPGMNSRAMQNVNVEQSERDFVQMEAIIQSMTREERENPSILNASRRKRIAAGSGQPVSKINQLVKRYDETRKMMKSFTGKGGAGRMNRMFRGM